MEEQDAPRALEKDRGNMEDSSCEADDVSFVSGSVLVIMAVFSGLGSSSFKDVTDMDGRSCSFSAVSSLVVLL